MNCTNDKEQLTHWINDQMTATEREEFAIHLANCEECKQELVIEQHLWNLIGEIETPEPSDMMEFKFNAMLEDYKDSIAIEKKNSRLATILEKFKQLWTMQPKFQLAYSLVLVIMGLGLGYLINHNGKNNINEKQVKALTSQVQEMKETTMLSLLNDPSASKRIQAISYTNEIKDVNKEVINALFATLNNDLNVNVRLMTLDALAGFADEPTVREGLVKSIVTQDSPLVQAALADVMLKLQEKSAVKPFKKLLEQKDLNDMVRNKIEETITSLI